MNCFKIQLNSKRILNIFRCSIRSWRVTLMNLRTGFTASTCIKERLEMTMTTLRWMMTGSWADSKYNRLFKAGRTRYSDSDRMYSRLCIVNLVNLSVTSDLGISVCVQAAPFWRNHQRAWIWSQYGHVSEYTKQWSHQCPSEDLHC